MVSFKGRHFTLPPSQMSPAPGVPIPILIGGHAEPALRRAARHDGWVGVHYGFDETKAVVAKLRGMLERRDEERPFTIQMAMDRIHPDVAERFSEMRIDAAVLPLFGLAKGPSLDDQLDAIQRTGEELALSPQPG
jgi:alkanesulfonate monooxygenase SsuD/methylene tetrahydromethanopterin reductase-like flavin-dependent oxidoreductase (luciferase family)